MHHNGKPMEGDESIGHEGAIGPNAYNRNRIFQQIVRVSCCYVELLMEVAIPTAAASDPGTEQLSSKGTRGQMEKKKK